MLAIDHRGHGRGLRPLVPFRLIDCAADAAGGAATLDAAPALVVGYSMGGAIAQLMARDHRDVVARPGPAAAPPSTGRTRDAAAAFKAMGALGLMLSVAPRATLAAGLAPRRPAGLAARRPGCCPR